MGIIRVTEWHDRTDVRANHVSQRMILLVDLNSGSVRYFRVFKDLDSDDPNLEVRRNKHICNAERHAQLFVILKDIKFVAIWGIHLVNWGKMSDG